jgi:hypothetical protein
VNFDDTLISFGGVLVPEADTVVALTYVHTIDKEEVRRLSMVGACRAGLLSVGESRRGESFHYDCREVG